MTNEAKTIEYMISLYCRKHHKKNEAAAGQALCDRCNMLLEYCLQRLEQCPQLPDKPVCSKCTIHCYNPDMRLYIRKVMRYAGPRMILRHPLITLHYLRRKWRGKGAER